MVEPDQDLNELTLRGTVLVITMTYPVKWRRDKVDLVELAHKYWVDQLSYKEIGESMGITKGQIDWNLRKIKSNKSSRHTPSIKELLALAKERKNEGSN